MSRKKRKNRQIAKAKEALAKAAINEFGEVLELTQEQMLLRKYEEEGQSGATNTLGDFFTEEQLKQIP